MALVVCRYCRRGQCLHTTSDILTDTHSYFVVSFKCIFCSTDDTTLLIHLEPIKWKCKFFFTHWLGTSDCNADLQEMEERYQFVVLPI